MHQIRINRTSRKGLAILFNINKDHSKSKCCTYNLHPAGGSDPAYNILDTVCFFTLVRFGMKLFIRRIGRVLLFMALNFKYTWNYFLTIYQITYTPNSKLKKVLRSLFLRGLYPLMTLEDRKRFQKDTMEREKSCVDWAKHYITTDGTNGLPRNISCI